MKPYIKLHKNGATVAMEKIFPSGEWLVQLRAPSGELFDKIRCDEYRVALTFRKAFNAIAKNMT